MCTCASCSYTDTFSGFKWDDAGKNLMPYVRSDGRGGFDSWPRGEPAGPAASRRAYSAHVAHSFYGAKKRQNFGPAGAGFYGTPAGSTRAEVEAVLRASFIGVQTPPEPGEMSNVEPITKHRSLAELARQLRREAEQERRAS